MKPLLNEQLVYLHLQLPLLHKRPALADAMSSIALPGELHEYVLAYVATVSVAQGLRVSQTRWPLNQHLLNLSL